jgi:type IV secretion system protein VirB9
MPFRALLLGTTLLYAAPALAAIDPPPASKLDGRIRTLVYDPNNPAEIYTVPGASLRLELGADEEVVQIIVSDQDTIAPDPAALPPAATVSTNSPGSQAGQIPASCDANLCRSVYGNIVYIKPIRALDPQPLFIQTRRTDAYGKPEMVAYTFELLTKPTEPVSKDVKTASIDKSSKTDGAATTPGIWAVRFVYPERVKQQATASWKAKQAAWVTQARETTALARPVATAPGPAANWRYGYRGAAALQPDQVWDDGRTTFLRYNGNRRVPNIYSQLPDGHESIPANAPEPDESGNTLRIAGTETKWFLRDGDEAGCLFDLGPDPDGRTSATVAAR